MLSHRSCFFKGKSFSAAPTEMIPQLPLICFDARSAAAREVQWTSFTRGCPRSGRKGRSVARRPALWLAVREVHVGLCLSFIAGRINWDSCGICDYCTAEWLFCITAFILGAVFVHIHLLPEGSSLLSAGQLLQSYTFTNVALCVHSCFVFVFFYNISSVSSKLLSIVPQQFLPHSDRKWQKRHGSCQERNTSEHLFTCPLPAARCMMGNRTDKRGQSVNRRNQAKVLVSLLQIWSLSEPLRLLLMVCHVENLSNWTQLVNSRAHWA